MPLVRLSTEESPSPNLAPMIDVVLVLTFFFMCATKFSGDERQLDLDLPQAASAALVEAARPRIVEVAAAGGLRLEGEEVSAEELVARLTSAGGREADIPVLIRGERAVPHGRMTEIYDACRTAGVRRVAISVRPRTGAVAP